MRKRKKVRRMAGTIASMRERKGALEKGFEQQHWLEVTSQSIEYIKVSLSRAILNVVKTMVLWAC